jgi:putative transcriptional regulator
MTIHHPAPDELLLDFAVGSTGPGKSLLVATHLSMCEDSRERYAVMEAIGGVLLASLEDSSLERIRVERVLEQADETEDERPRPAEAAPQRPAPASRIVSCGRLGTVDLPQPLSAFAEEVESPRSWRRLGLGVEAAVLPVSTPLGKTQLLRARPGVRILRHTHLGEELVLILKGAFWDGDERFGPGDVAICDRSVRHAPIIDRDEGCLCLAVTEGPIKFLGPLGWLLNRFNRF